jgi:alkylated DNA repair dioxygenase AlkB
MRAKQPDLFAAAAPDGFRYAEELLSAEEEAELLHTLRGLPFEEARYKEWTARRRVVSYGGRYDFGANELEPAPPIPPGLHGLRTRIASWSGVPAERFTHAAVAEYRPGTPLGWHRDVPQFDIVVGVSLAGSARMRFRRYPHVKGSRAATLDVELAPRSIYVLRDAARWEWQHAIAPTAELRYSITFRTLRTDASSSR